MLTSKERKKIKIVLIAFGILLIPMTLLIIRIYAIQLNDDAINFYFRGGGKGYSKEEAAEIAIEKLDKSIRLMKYNPVPYYNKVSIYTNIGKKQESIETLEKLIERDPHNFYAYLEIGRQYELLGEEKQANEFYSIFLIERKYKNRLEKLKKKNYKEYLIEELITAIVLNDRESFEALKTNLLIELDKDPTYDMWKDQYNFEDRDDILNQSLQMYYGL